MPVSKRRKGAAKQRKPAIAPTAPKSTGWRIRLNPSQLVFIKDNPDFRTMIKIGRTMNAIMFASTIVIQNMECKTFTEGRQYFRSYLILGGYLHEAIKVVLAVKGSYLGDPHFEPLRVLALDAKHKKVRPYLKKVRNFAAFRSMNSTRPPAAPFRI